MRLDIGVYGVLLAAGLGAAYWASKPATESDEEKVAVFTIDPKAVSEISYKAKDVDAAAARRDDGRFWVTHIKTEAPPPPPPATKDQPAPPAAAPKVTTERFLANDKMTELLQALSPLSAARVFDNVDAKQLEEYGLKDKAEVFSVKGTDGKTFTLYLGKRSYGSRSRFAQEDSGNGGKGRVLLVDDTPFENLERAPVRMYDRRLVSFDMGDVQKAEVRVGERVKRLSHTRREKSGELLWTEDEENAQPKPLFGTWMDKIDKLRLLAYADEKEEASLKDVKPFLEVTFEKDGKAVDRLLFKKTPGDTPVYWVTSDFLKAHAKVQNARVEPVEKDIDAVLGDAKS